MIYVCMYVRCRRACLRPADDFPGSVLEEAHFPRERSSEPISLGSGRVCATFRFFKFCPPADGHRPQRDVADALVAKDLRTIFLRKAHLRTFQSQPGRVARVFLALRIGNLWTSKKLGYCSS